MRFVRGLFEAHGLYSPRQNQKRSFLLRSDVVCLSCFVVPCSFNGSVHTVVFVHLFSFSRSHTLLLSLSLSLSLSLARFQRTSSCDPPRSRSSEFCDCAVITATNRPFLWTKTNHNDTHTQLLPWNFSRMHQPNRRRPRQRLHHSTTRPHYWARAAPCRHPTFISWTRPRPLASRHPRGAVHGVGAQMAAWTWTR